MSPRRGRGAALNESAADAAAARLAALALLARRDYANGELHARLRQRGFVAAAAAEAVGMLTAEGAVNDARYAENYVTYHAGRGQGPTRIGAELRARGVAPELIEAALANGPDWRAVARAARERRFGRQLPGSWRERARQGRFLQYRGFSSDHIRAALGADPDAD
jgi:regulatory protein